MKKVILEWQTDIPDPYHSPCKVALGLMEWLCFTEEFLQISTNFTKEYIYLAPFMR